MLSLEVLILPLILWLVQFLRLVSENWTGILEWLTGLLDWNTGLEYWNGLNYCKKPFY